LIKVKAGRPLLMPDHGMASAASIGWHGQGGLDEHQLAGLIARHASHARLCTRLEALADRLPSRPGPVEARRLCRDVADYRADQATPDDALAAALAGLGATQPAARTIATHIGACRSVTAASADEVIAMLDPDRTDEPRLCAEAFGFLLRNFFDTGRYALALEEIGLMMIAGERIEPDARALLEARLAMTRY
jgi:hypothetical protein